MATLPRDYRHAKDIETVLMELTDEVCQRARSHHKAGKTVTVSVRRYDLRSGFHRQSSLVAPSNLSSVIFKKAKAIFEQHWDGQPVRSIGVSISNLHDDQDIQLELFTNLDKEERISRVLDQTHARFGKTALLRASALTTAGISRDRATKIGGHYK